jgi:imidazolonepropionase-like amidohydrolase
VRRAVRQLVKEGADFIKIVATGGSTRSSIASRPAFNPDEMHALVDEAHKLGRTTAAHSSSTQGILNALEAGVDTIIHCRFIEPDGTIKYRPDVADAIAAAGRWVDGTLAQGLFRVHTLEWKRDSGQALTETEKQEIERGHRSADTLKEHFRQMLAAGIKMVSGSDSSWMWYPMGHYQEEVIEHAAWGMSNSDARRRQGSGSTRCGRQPASRRHRPARRAASLPGGSGDPLVTRGRELGPRHVEPSETSVTDPSLRSG